MSAPADRVVIQCNRDLADGGGHDPAVQAGVEVTTAKQEEFEQRCEACWDYFDADEETSLCPDCESAGAQPSDRRCCCCAAAARRASTNEEEP